MTNKFKEALLFVGGVLYASGKASMSTFWLLVVFLWIASFGVVIPAWHRVFVAIILFMGEYIYSLLQFRKARGTK